MGNVWCLGFQPWVGCMTGMFSKELKGSVAIRHHSDQYCSLWGDLPQASTLPPANAGLPILQMLLCFRLSLSKHNVRGFRKRSPLDGIFPRPGKAHLFLYSYS